MNAIEDYLDEMQRVLAAIPASAIGQAVALLHEAWRNGRQVFLIGNGGSASTASHMANDLSKATIAAGKPRMRVMALTDNVSLLTAWANDVSFDLVFKEQLENLMQPGDLVVAISASGNSPNILRAIEHANEHGGVTLGWTGRSGGLMKALVHCCVQAPTDDVGMIESAHLVLDHLVTTRLAHRIRVEGHPAGERRDGGAAATMAAGRRPASAAVPAPVAGPHLVEPS